MLFKHEIIYHDLDCRFKKAHNIYLDDALRKQFLYCSKGGKIEYVAFYDEKGTLLDKIVYQEFYKVPRYPKRKRRLLKK